MSKLKAPFGWIGGKSKLAQEIVQMFPEHKYYREVFGGGLSVFYEKTPSKVELINDINGELVNLHRMIQRRPETLSMYLNKMLISRTLFANIFSGRIKPKNRIEQAAFYYYVITQSFGSKSTTFAMNAKSRRPKNIYRSFTKWSERLKFVTIEEMSFEKLIETYDNEDAFFYCDPPYYGTEHYYKNIDGFGKEQHILLRDILAKIKGKFLLSYNDDPYIRELYKDFKCKTSKELNYTLNMSQKKSVTELYILNY